MSVVHSNHIRIEKHEEPHRTAQVENFGNPIHFGVHGGNKHFYEDKYGREIAGTQYPAQYAVLAMRLTRYYRFDILRSVKRKFLSLTYALSTG